MPYTFTPPEYTRRPANGGRLLSRYSFPYSYSVIKRGASYETVISPVNELFFDPEVDFIYRGGRVYPVSAEEAVLLQAAGYEVRES